MYESTLEIPGRSDALAGQELAAMAWPELVAQLAARRDLRRVLLAGEAGHAASFNANAAAMLAGLAQDKRDINRDALIDGKQPWAKPAEAADDATAGDREF